MLTGRRNKDAPILCIFALQVFLDTHRVLFEHTLLAPRRIRCLVTADYVNGVTKPTGLVRFGNNE